MHAPVCRGKSAEVGRYHSSWCVCVRGYSIFQGLLEEQSDHLINLRHHVTSIPPTNPSVLWPLIPYRVDQQTAIQPQTRSVQFTNSTCHWTRRRPVHALVWWVHEGNTSQRRHTQIHHEDIRWLGLYGHTDVCSDALLNCFFYIYFCTSCLHNEESSSTSLINVRIWPSLPFSNLDRGSILVTTAGADWAERVCAPASNNKQKLGLPCHLTLGSRT